MFHVPEFGRIRHGLLASTSKDGNNGAFALPLGRGRIADIIASDGMGWEHVSVKIRLGRKLSTPTWHDMCRVKNEFWDKGDCVVQYHPPALVYVNTHPHVLHLWRPNSPDIPEIPIPNPWLVGIPKLTL